jgi:hypothetical protein
MPPLICLPGLGVPLHHRNVLDQHFAGFHRCSARARFAAVAPGDYPHLVVLLDLNAKRLGRLVQ